MQRNLLNPADQHETKKKEQSTSFRYCHCNKLSSLSNNRRQNRRSSSHAKKSQSRLVIQSLYNVTLAFTLWGSGYCCREYNFFISSISALRKRRNASGYIVFLLPFIIRVSNDTCSSQLCWRQIYVHQCILCIYIQYEAL
jgi:hypothetical protein